MYNGQDVERANHATLVSIIQNCPTRIRMIVVFENCVRKVELHMRYMHLHSQLQSKEQDYQKMCATERILIGKLNASRRGPISVTATLGPAVVSTSYDHHELSDWTNNCGYYNYGSQTQDRCTKSMPRSAMKSSHSFIHSPNGASGYSSQMDEKKMQSTNGKRSNGCFKRSSYSCLGGGVCDCDGCLHGSARFKREPATDSNTRTKHQTRAPNVSWMTGQLQRPKSCHFSSCYQTALDDLEPAPSDRTVDWTTKSYGGYGFGYDFKVASTSSSPHHKVSTAGTATYTMVPSYDRRSLPKSAEDLLAAQLRDHCRMKTDMTQKSVAGIETMTFYTRPSQPLTTSYRSRTETDQSGLNWTGRPVKRPL